MRVGAVHAIPAEIVTAQIEAVFADLGVGAIKIGMLGNADVIVAVAHSLANYDAVPVILDPVLVATSGARLLPEQALDALISHLLPQARLLTPNLLEAAALTNSPIARDEAAMVAQGRALLKMGAQAVLIKGGHGTGQQSVDLLVDANRTMRFVAERLDAGEIHGGGCIFSAAIAAGLASGTPLAASITRAKHFISRAIASAPSQALGSGARLLHTDRWHSGL